MMNSIEKDIEQQRRCLALLLEAIRKEGIESHKSHWWLGIIQREKMYHHRADRTLRNWDQFLALQLGIKEASL